jgi:hypothetical protein
LRLRLPPAPGTVSHALAVGDQHEALTAVQRLALRFGLRPDSTKAWSPAQAWVIRTYFRPGGGALRLRLEATPCPDGGLDVHLSEFITKQWTPKGDSLRRALADTLAQFGAVPSR